jgi:subtilisin family serine protease
MKKTLVLVALCLVSLSAFAGHVVLFKGSGAPSDFAAQVAARGGTVTYQHEILALVSGLDDASASGLAGVAQVEADVEFTLDVAGVDAEAAFDNTPASPAAPATAFFYPRQWHLRSIGAQHAWAAGRLGVPSVKVAILDTGIDRRSNQHPDLVGRVDYTQGMQFQLDNPLCIPVGFTFNPTDDLMFHGTHVAATVSSNAIAAAGVTSGVTLVPVKVLGLTSATPTPGGCGNGSGSLGNVLAGVLYAADIDADVANMSLGGGFGKAGNGRFVGMINQVFGYAHRQGTLMVVSAGNEALDLDHDGNLYKSYCSSPNTVCVSALGPTSRASVNGPWFNENNLAGYSNFGRSAISVAAPGGNGASSVTAACSRSSVSGSLAICQTGTFVVGSNGTSMASPHVSGLAALLVETVGKDRPSQIKAILQQTADDLGQPGTDPAYGKGKINVPAAIGLQ